VDILEKINKHAERSGDIIRHLRKLIRREQPSYTKVNINELIEDVLILMKPEIKKAGVVVKREFDKNIPAIFCQSIQIDQVVLNLCKNAIESMQDIIMDKNLKLPLSDQRVLSITTQMGGKHAVIVSISDTGAGIKDEIINGLFAPFISSKKEGMGLGLSISQGIIEAHRGKLYLVSEKQTHLSSEVQNVGTTFRFVLPSFDHKHNGESI
jgi:two-component system sensor histidine kinase TtrS